jgi:hypothetical protein
LDSEPPAGLVWRKHFKIAELNRLGEPRPPMSIEMGKARERSNEVRHES